MHFLGAAGAYRAFAQFLGLALSFRRPQALARPQGARPGMGSAQRRLITSSRSGDLSPVAPIGSWHTLALFHHGPRLSPAGHRASAPFSKALIPRTSASVRAPTAAFIAIRGVISRLGQAS